MNNELIFCNASVRPNCLLETNLCCLICQKIEACYQQSGKIKPCLPDDYLDDEKCCFLI